MGFLSNNTGRAHAEPSAMSLLPEFFESRPSETYMIMAIAIILITAFVSRSSAGKYKRIPSPNALQALVGVSKDPVDFITNIIKTKGYIFKIGKVIFVSDYQFSLLIQKGDKSIGIEPTDKPYTKAFSRLAWGDEKFMVTKQMNEGWHPIRKGIAAGFSMRSVREMLKIANNVTQQFFQYIDSQGYTKSQQSINLSNLLIEYAANSDAAVLMDKTDNKFGDPEGSYKFLCTLMEMLSAVSHRMRNPISALMYKLFPSKQEEHLKRTAYLLKYSYDLIDKRRKLYAEHGEPNMQFLLDQCMKIPYARDKARAVDLIQLQMNFTAIYTEMGAILEVGLHPEVQRKLQSELDMVNPERKGFDVDMLSECSYLQRVMDEAMRLHPGGAIMSPRVITADMEYEGYTLPKGSYVQAPLYHFLRDSRYLKDPDMFNPDRWAPDSSELPVLADMKSSYFAQGPRSCPGKPLAEASTKAFIASFLQRYEVEIVDPGTRCFFIILKQDGVLARLRDR
jgi:cytochrome P450